MESISKLPYGTCSLAMSGKNSNSSFNVFKTLYNDSWVLDLGGAIDHMMPCSSVLTSYVFLFSKHIIIANATCIPIIGCGNVSLLPSLNLKDVLYILKLSKNLIFVQKLTNDLKCCITFVSRFLGSPGSCHREDNLEQLRDRESCIVLTTWETPLAT